MLKQVRGDWLMIIGACVMIAATVWALATFASNRRAVRETRQAVRALLNAGARFRLEYGYWPGLELGRGRDVRFGVNDQPNRHIMQVLQGRKEGGPSQERTNPRGIVFWDPPVWRPNHVGVNESGELLDPWGMPFQIVVDGDLNGLCEIPRSMYGSVEVGMLVWSYGPDRRSETPDDIRSWEKTNR